MDYQSKNIDFFDSKTWDLICAGHTNGMFQCESSLVQDWLKKIKPRSIWELSIVISLVRPGPLKSGFAASYVHNKNEPDNQEKFNHETIDSILSNTSNCLVFQEQIMQLGSRLAWPHLPDKERELKVDLLRKAVGKKNQQKILEIGNDFITGCNHNKVDVSISTKLFEAIKNSGRYAFNLSHSIRYAKTGYITAFYKTNYPLIFYTVYLSYAKDKLDKFEEIHRLVTDCKLNQISVVSPNFNLLNTDFIIQNNEIVYGLSHIKYGLNRKNIVKLKSKVPVINNLYTFIKLILNVYNYDATINSRTFESLIITNAFRDTGYSRKILLNLYKFLDTLTEKEKKNLILADKYGSLEGFYNSIYSDVIPNTNINRKSVILSNLIVYGINSKEPLHTYDNPAWVESNEKNLLGTNISACILDGKNITSIDSCRDLSLVYPKFTKKSVSVVIDQIKMTVTRKGKNPGQKMCRITVHDSTSEVQNLPVFPELFNKTSTLLLEGNTVKLDVKNLDNGWVIENIEQI